MRNCEKCGKANQPTRKFCIRCGASLIKAQKPPPAKAPLPGVESQERSRVIVGSDMSQQQAQAGEPLSPTTQDQWVKPSEVARNRVRQASGPSRGKSEFEKAKEAFARAETVGIDEEGTGIIETRMLRASEVKELLEGPGMMEGSEEFAQPQMMPGSEPLPPEAAEMTKPAAPSQSQIEKQILGSKSTFISEEGEPTPKPPTLEATTIAPSPSGEFTSVRQEGAGSPPTATQVTAPVASTQDAPVSAVDDEDDFLDLVIACPACGHVMNVDMFDYPNDVYSAMGDARLKQARYFIVQGKPSDAKRVLGVARALYEKAADKNGLAETNKLSDSIEKRG